MLKNICFIDLETTGLHYVNDHPIELGACLYDIEQSKIVKEYNIFIAPPKNSVMNEFAQKIHGVTLEQARERGVEPEVAMYDFFSIMGTDYSFGGWNVQFDVSFFRRMCYESLLDEEYGKVHYRHMDVQSFVRGLCDAGMYDKDIKSLDDARKIFGIKRNDNHEAAEDAIIACKVYKELKINVWTDLIQKYGGGR